MAVNKTLIRSCVLYEYKLGTNAAEAARKICIAFGDDVVSRRTAQKWFQKFSRGDFILIDKARSGRPKIINNQNLKVAVERNSSTTCLELAETFNVNDETIRLHLHQLGKKWKLSKWVPHNLSDDNKLSRITICSANFSRHQNEPFLDRLLTCDEKWILYSNSKRSYHWLSSSDAIPHTPKNNLHPKNVYCVFGGRQPELSIMSSWKRAKPSLLRSIVISFSEYKQNSSRSSLL